MTVSATGETYYCNTLSGQVPGRRCAPVWTFPTAAAQPTVFGASDPGREAAAFRAKSRRRLEAQLEQHRGVLADFRAAGAAVTELAMLVGCVGVASNLAACRALATDGIQRGHMALHARSVAIAAGAKADEVELVAAAIHGAETVNFEAAKRALVALREDSTTDSESVAPVATKREDRAV